MTEFSRSVSGERTWKPGTARFVMLQAVPCPAGRRQAGKKPLLAVTARCEARGISAPSRDRKGAVVFQGSVRWPSAWPGPLADARGSVGVACYANVVTEP